MKNTNKPYCQPMAEVTNMLVEHQLCDTSGQTHEILSKDNDIAWEDENADNLWGDEEGGQ